MKKLILLVLFIFAALLLASCGTDDESASGNSEKEELPDSIPADFPFPDSMWNVHVGSMEMSGGATHHTIAFSHREDTEEIYKKMKAYLDDKGCAGEEINGQYVCNEFEGDEYLIGTKVNIGDKVSSVSFTVYDKK